MGRKTLAIIDLEALQANLQVAKYYAGPAKIIAVIKANAYGHGAIEAAEALAAADMFGLASLEEAVELRLAGVDKPLLLLSGFHSPDDLEEIASLSLHTVIHCQQQLTALLNTDLSAPIDVWLKMDTGMHRLGFTTEEVGQVFQQLDESDQVASVRLMSHFATADEPGNPLQQQQLSCFQHCYSGLEAEFSLCNSAALIDLPEARGDWVRPGIMLYGCNPFTEPGNHLLNHTDTDTDTDNHSHPVCEQLKPVMSLQTRVIALHKVAAGESVGYGQRWTADSERTIATLAIGYGDGYPRHAPNGTPVLINGQRASLVGTVSMDMITVDVSDLPETAIGDKAILWGEDLPVEKIAQRCGTISYQLLTGINKRVARQYLLPR